MLFIFVVWYKVVYKIIIFYVRCEVTETRVEPTEDTRGGETPASPGPLTAHSPAVSQLLPAGVWASPAQGNVLTLTRDQASLRASTAGHCTVWKCRHYCKPSFICKHFISAIFACLIVSRI